MDLNKIKTKIQKTKEENPKKVKTVDGFKEEIRVNRDDILEVLNHYADEKNEKKNIKSFLDQLDMEEGRKVKIIDDLDSYPVSYPRTGGKWKLQ